MKISEIILETTSPNNDKFNLSWDSVPNKKFINQVLNSALSHAKIWSAAIKTSDEIIRNYSQKFDDAMGSALGTIKQRDLQYFLSVLQKAAYDDDGDDVEDTMIGNAKYVLGSTLALLLHDVTTPRNEFPKTSEDAIRMNLSVIVSQANKGDELCVLILPALLVFKRTGDLDSKSRNSGVQNNPSDTSVSNRSEIEQQ